ncbi:MAG: hypothetical protein LBL66_09435 [Clostridiales bacterium]|jgi:ABC-type glycerol-3-phosphate transport system permease component|nr:hypothetical protein [Clostridiales bacterium]
MEGKTVKRKRITVKQTALVITVAALCLTVLFPFWLLAVKSFKSFEQEIASPISLSFPLFFENYSVAWAYVKE